MIPLWQLRCLAVWYRAGYRYRLVVGIDYWRFVFVSSTGGSHSITCDTTKRQSPRLGVTPGAATSIADPEDGPTLIHVPGFWYGHDWAIDERFDEQTVAEVKPEVPLPTSLRGADVGN